MGKLAALQIQVFRHCGQNAPAARTHRNKTQLRRANARLTAGRNGFASKSVPRAVLIRTQRAPAWCRTTASDGGEALTRGAGEPPGHTHRHFCRGGSPKFFEGSGQHVFRLLSALVRYTTQLTSTVRRDATRRRDANFSASGRRTRQTQRRRHSKSSTA